jgi:hypothetical protein
MLSNLQDFTQAPVPNLRIVIRFYIYSIGALDLFTPAVSARFDVLFVFPFYTFLVTLL